jgi:3-methyladenine DNA glycosylase Mpg
VVEEELPEDMNKASENMEGEANFRNALDAECGDRSIDYPAAVLIRAVEGIVGPARLTKALAINSTLNGQPATEATGLWFSEGSKPTRQSITRSARIGVDYAGAVWSAKPYRFSLKTAR